MNTTLTPKDKPHPKPVEVLLVEDNPADISLLTQTFRKSRFPIHLNVVEDGEQAIAYLRNRSPYFSAPRPDFVLLDLNLPRKSGHEVAAEMKRSNKLSGIPALILTGSDLEHDRWQAYHNHVDAYLVKPHEWSQYGVLLKYLEENWIQGIHPNDRFIF